MRASLLSRTSATIITMLDAISVSGANRQLMRNTKHLIEKLNGRVNTLENALREEAAYCQKHEDECAERGETERAARHRIRKERLLAYCFSEKE